MKKGAAKSASEVRMIRCRVRVIIGRGVVIV